MRALTTGILILFACLAPVSVYAQQGKQAPLPRVLIIGDSIYTQYARGVTAELKGKAGVDFANWPRDEIANSATALKHLDQLLGRRDQGGKEVPEEKRPRWDLIHVNVGLGDLVYRAPGMESFRLLPIHAGGVVATPPKQYEDNLKELIRALKATGAKVVWASTTPIRASRSNVFKVGSEIEYNKIAEKVMKGHGVPINDMHAYAKSIMNMDKPAGHGADPFNFDKKPIHPPVVEVIAKQLGLKIKKPKPAEKTAKKD